MRLNQTQRKIRALRDLEDLITTIKDMVDFAAELGVYEVAVQELRKFEAEREELRRTI